MPASVECVTCRQTISLDKWSRYYPGLWFEHHKKCMELNRYQAIRNIQVYLWNWAVLIFELICCLC
jgi:hypothetical protein